MLLTENDVVEAVCQFLTTHGWQVTSRCGTLDKGIDIVATGPNGQVQHVETKGATSSKKSSPRYGSPFDDRQVKTHVSKAFFTAATGFGSGVQGAIALPETKLHLKYLRLLQPALANLGIIVYLVSADYSVRTWGGT